jgi:hypothetical protein
MSMLTLSLMPADLDAQLDPQQTADLIAFMRGEWLRDSTVT